MKTLLVAAVALSALTAPAFSQDSLALPSPLQLPSARWQVDTVEGCPSGEGVQIIIGEGGFVTGPFSMSARTENVHRPNGDTFVGRQDLLTVSPGQVIKGPLAVCTAPVAKPDGAKP